MNITQVGSPNYTKGRQGNKITGVIIHWMVGTLSSADAVFQNTSRNTSAHYGIEDTTVHQYVSTDDTAYHCGNWTVNTQTIGIEHSAQPGRDASQATLDTSAQLIADLAKKYGFAINDQTVRPHNRIVATQCPGTINVNYLIAKANELVGSSIPTPAPIVPTPAASLETVTVAVPKLNVRSAPTTSASLAGSMTLNQGDTFQITGRVQGQNVSGVSTWVRSTKGNYVWAGGLVGQTSAPVPVQNESGWATVIVPALNVRSQPNTGGAIVGSGVLYQGDRFQYTAVVDGQDVGGNNKWLKSIKGNYVWSGGVSK